MTDAPGGPKPDEKKRFKVRYAFLVPGLVLLGTGALGACVGLIKSFGAIGGESFDPSQKARILADGISEAINFTAFGLLILLLGALLLWVGWRALHHQRPPS